MRSVADAWGRRKRRLSWFVLLATLALTAIVFWFFTLPSWRKIASWHWPSVAAHAEQISKASSGDGRDWIVAGTRVKIRFRYASPDGVAREATQEVSKAWASAHQINEYGYFMPATLDGRDRPWELTCFVDPADPGRAVLEQSIGHADVPALGPLLVLLFGGLMFVAERRNAANAGDLSVRARSRNGQRWRIDAYDDVLIATAAVDVMPDAMLFTALVNWPVLSVSVRPHPATLGGHVVVELSHVNRRRWRRQLRVRLMLGPFSGSGRPGDARWSADVFDGSLEPDRTIATTIALPRAGDLPAGVDDCWLRITARTTLGLPWSRTLWIALDDGTAR